MSNTPSLGEQAAENARQAVNRLRKQGLPIMMMAPVEEELLHAQQPCGGCGCSKLREALIEKWTLETFNIFQAAANGISMEYARAKATEQVDSLAQPCQQPKGGDDHDAGQGITSGEVVAAPKFNPSAAAQPASVGSEEEAFREWNAQHVHDRWDRGSDPTPYEDRKAAWDAAIRRLREESK